MKVRELIDLLLDPSVPLDADVGVTFDGDPIPAITKVHLWPGDDSTIVIECTP